MFLYYTFKKLFPSFYTMHHCLQLLYITKINAHVTYINMNQVTYFLRENNFSSCVYIHCVHSLGWGLLKF